MQPSDLAHLVVPVDPQLHPDGLRTAYVRTAIDVEGDRYLRAIHLDDGTTDRRFTHGPVDSMPRWSPDGRLLAFLRKGSEQDAKAQLHVMPADGGEAHQRTDVPLGVTDLAWSPDGRHLVFVAGRWDDEVADLDDDERRRRPKRITRVPYRADGRGWIHDRTARLHLVEATGRAGPVLLDTGPRDVSAPNWHPDGTTIAYIADPDDWPETEPHSQVFALRLPSEEDLQAAVTADDDGEEAGRVPALGVERSPLTPPGMWQAVHHAPDGTVFVTGIEDPYQWPGASGIWLLSRPGAIREDVHLVPLTAHLDRAVNPGSPSCATVGPRFVDDGFLTVLEGRGTSGIVHVELAGFDSEGDGSPRVTERVGGPRAVTGYSASDDGTIIVFTATDPATPGELFRREHDHERPLTDLASSLRERVEIRETQRFTVTRDGIELDVWAVLPAGFAAASERRFPVLLNIHGGPTAQYGDHFFDEFQVEASAGYLVVGTNPRGSSGRGTEWARAVVGAWGEEDSVDTLDLEAVVDATCERFPQADPERVGIMGGSYGGYATARLLARTDRYGSAIVERGLLQWESFAGTSDIGPYFDRMFLGRSLDDGAEVHRAASPATTAHRITTPTLVLHSEHDWRCPVEQGEQLFTALKRAGTPTEMVRFPDEGHELSRSGTPRHRVERFEVVLEWHERHLAHERGSTPS
ncbi:MAG: S9 family peptidase [Nitriliruptoraceae bacterium]